MTENTLNNALIDRILGHEICWISYPCGCVAFPKNEDTATHTSNLIYYSHLIHWTRPQHPLVKHPHLTRIVVTRTLPHDILNENSPTAITIFIVIFYFGFLFWSFYQQCGQFTHYPHPFILGIIFWGNRRKRLQALENSID